MAAYVYRTAICLDNDGQITREQLEDTPDMLITSEGLRRGKARHLRYKESYVQDLLPERTFKRLAPLS